MKGVCVSDTQDFAVNMGDVDASMAAKVNCGTHTTLNATTNTCELDPAGGICPQGFVLDTTNFNCVAPSAGTLVKAGGLMQVWSNIARVNPAPPDGGSMYQPLGTGTGGVSVVGVADTDLLFMSKSPFAPMGGSGTGNGAIPVFWAEGPGTSVPTYATHQYTFGEWKKCKATYAFYKDPPTAPTGTKWYKEVVDVAGCPPGVMFGIWNQFSKSDQQVDRVVSAPAGGLPEAVITDSTGQGHFERDLDPAVWFMSNIPMGGIAHGSTTLQNIPDLTTFPNASLLVTVIYQNQGQTNGNPGWCAKDPNAHNIDGNNVPANTICTQTASAQVFLPGQAGVTEGATMLGVAPQAGQEAYCSNGACSAMPLSMLQPY